MVDQQLISSVSDLSLDTPVSNGSNAVGGKKGRRPIRAFHNLASNVSVQSLYSATQSTTSVAMNELSEEQSGAFTPKAFNGPNMAVSFSTGSPLVASIDKADSPFLQSSGHTLPIQAMSNVLALQRWEDQLLYSATAFDTLAKNVPPIPTTQYYSLDRGGCDSRLMALSMYRIPVDDHKKSATELPLGLTVQPFAKTYPEVPVDVVESKGEEEVLRCKRCRAYVNPNFVFTYDSSFTCNICKIDTKLSFDQTVPIGVDGRRSDYAMRPELYKGAVDFVVTEKYNAFENLKPLPLHYVFVIDVSIPANENGGSLAFIEGVRDSIKYIIEHQPNCKVAIFSFDDKLRFYNLKASNQNVAVSLVSEVDDVFLPFIKGLFVNPKESLAIITDTLDAVADFVTNHKHRQVVKMCYGSALQAAKLALDTVTGGQGGKIICSIGSLPTVGYGSLIDKKDDCSRANLEPENGYYTKLANSMVRSYISLDLFVTSSAFVDLATVAYPTLATMGNLKYYHNFHPMTTHTTVVNDMITSISKIVGYQALLKVRTSDGLSVAQYYTEPAKNSNTDPVIPVVTTDTVVDTLLKYTSKLKGQKQVFFQAAILFTDVNGVRKVRSINTSADVSSQINDLFKYANQNVIMRLMIKHVLTYVRNYDFVKVRKEIDEKLSKVATQYKALVSGNSSTQIVLADTLSTLPTYMLSLQKSELMKPIVKSSRSNTRIYDYYKIMMHNQTELLYKLYPQIIPLHIPLEAEDLTFCDEGDTQLQLMASSLDQISVRNSRNSIINGGCYLIFDGSVIYIWINENTNRMLLQDLMGLDHLTPITQLQFLNGQLPKTGTVINEKAHNIIKNWSQNSNNSFIPVVPLRPAIDHHYQQVMTSILLEDQTINKIEALETYIHKLDRSSQKSVSSNNFVNEQSTMDSDQAQQKFIQF